MIKLDYQTQNPRWGWTGMEYTSWDNYAFGLGFLSNIGHYRNGNGKLIEVHVEGNDNQGAWGREGRIQYYGTLAYLQRYFPDWDACRSAGNNSITCRMNSNDYIYSLVSDYDFIVKTYRGYTTADIFPPNNAYETVWNHFSSYIQRTNRNLNIGTLQTAYDDGWNL